MADIARIIEIVEPQARALGFDLVRVALFGKTEVGDEEHTLQIMAERPETGQLLIEECAALSRAVSDQLDIMEASGDILVDGAYRLEVSSPGIDRPLTRPKDYTAWIGHEVRIELSELIDQRKRFRAIWSRLTRPQTRFRSKRMLWYILYHSLLSPEQSLS